jgi:hypothetical protein
MFRELTSNRLPRNIQDKILNMVNKNRKERREFYKEFDNMLKKAENRKNLMREGFMMYSMINSHRNGAKNGNKLSMNMLNRHFRSRKKVADFFFNNTSNLTKNDKRYIINKMLFDKSYQVFSNDLKNIKNRNNLSQYKNRFVKR